MNNIFEGKFWNVFGVVVSGAAFVLLSVALCATPYLWWFVNSFNVSLFEGDELYASNTANVVTGGYVAMCIVGNIVSVVCAGANIELCMRKKPAKTGTKIFEATPSAKGDDNEDSLEKFAKRMRRINTEDLCSERFYTGQVVGFTWDDGTHVGVVHSTCQGQTGVTLYVIVKNCVWTVNANRRKAFVLFDSVEQMYCNLC